jgi:hypothetical protein
MLYVYSHTLRVDIPPTAYEHRGIMDYEAQVTDYKDNLLSDWFESVFRLKYQRHGNKKEPTVSQAADSLSYYIYFVSF